MKDMVVWLAQHMRLKDFKKKGEPKFPLSLTRLPTFQSRTLCPHHHQYQQ
jgi:hypothetical protein